MSPERPARLEQRRAVLFAALSFAQAEIHEPAIDALKTWLNSWRGLGDVVVGMNRQEFKLTLTQLDATTWRAMFLRNPCCPRMASAQRRRFGFALVEGDAEAARPLHGVVGRLAREPA